MGNTQTTSEQKNEKVVTSFDVPVATEEEDISTITGNKWWNCDICGESIVGACYFTPKEGEMGTEI